MTDTGRLIEAKKVADPENADGAAIENACRAVSIESQSALKSAVGALADIKTQYKRADDKRHSFVDPLLRVVDDLNAMFSPALDALANAEKILKSKVVEFTESRLAERDALIGEVQHTDPTQRATLIERAEALVPAKVSGLAIEETASGKVVDSDAIMKWAIASNRLDLLLVNEKALAAIARSGVDPQIPGFKVERKRTVAITVSKDK